MRTKTEHEEQREFVSWFRKNHSDVRIFAIPNGGERSLSQASRLKCEGVLKGVPDLFIPAWNLWIEMKTENGRLSPEQKDWLTHLESFCGHSTLVCYGCEDAQNQVLAFKKLTR